MRSKTNGIILGLALILVNLTPASKGQAQAYANVNGYLSMMPSVMFEDIEGQWVSDNLFHNRLNLSASPGFGLSFQLEARSRLLYGETVKYTPGYANLIGKDPGWIDMSYNLRSDTSFILNSSIDRLSLDFNIGSLQLTFGRQRINWGMNFVWNPNDIFNSYSFFDFDYIERPGSDAVRLQYYLSSTSSMEAVAKINPLEEWSIASLLRINLAGTDFQILAGIMDETDYVLGGGFSGYLGPVSLSAEISYLDPIDDQSQESAILSGFGISYNTPFQLFIQSEYLYNTAAADLNLNSFQDFYFKPLSIRDLSPSLHTVFASLSYPATPLLNLGFSGMFFSSLNGFYVGPSLDLSLRNDLDLSMFVQSFGFELNEKEQNIHMGFLRLKWSF